MVEITEEKNPNFVPVVELTHDGVKGDTLLVLLKRLPSLGRPTKNK